MATRIKHMQECKHCDRKAVWRWEDADGNERSDICQRCLETLSFYQDKPIWQFEHLESSDIKAQPHY